MLDLIIGLLLGLLNGFFIGFYLTAKLFNDGLRQIGLAFDVKLTEKEGD
ncbi:hypothetical protein [Oceanobacillus sojae]